MHQSGDGFLGEGETGVAVFFKNPILLSGVCVFRPVFVSLRCEGVMMTHVGGV